MARTLAQHTHTVSFDAWTLDGAHFVGQLNYRQDDATPEMAGAIEAIWAEGRARPIVMRRVPDGALVTLMLGQGCRVQIGEVERVPAAAEVSG